MAHTSTVCSIQQLYETSAAWYGDTTTKGANIVKDNLHALCIILLFLAGLLGFCYLLSYIPFG
jgi:hypothetical protein